MCHDGNSAPASVRYLNSQLSASWQNAHDCATHHQSTSAVDLGSAEYKQSQYMRSLAEFHYGGEHHARGLIRKELLFFNGSFGQPSLQFICNHEAILHLNLADGHLNTNTSKVNFTDPRVNTQEHTHFQDLQIAVRMKFQRRAISSEDVVIGNGEHIIQLMVLDFDSARVLTRVGHIAHDVLSFYIRKYLQFLRNAGHHVLFDLPDFDNDQYSPHIDYSLATTSQEIDNYCADIDIHGVHVAAVNEHLRKLWLNAVVSSRGISGVYPEDYLSTCLMEVKSTWLPDLQSFFHVKFSPPTVRNLCPHEAVLVFDINDLLFYDSADFDAEEIEKFWEWKVAVIVNTIEIRNERGVVIGFNFDFHSARFYPHLSTSVDENDDAFVYFQTLINFIMDQYIQLLISYKFYEVHVLEIPVVQLPAGPTGPQALPWEEAVIRRPLFGFDQILAISEESINATFATLWRHARDTRTLADDLLIRWMVDNVFAAEYDAIKVELLSSNQAIIRINVKQGSMTIKEPEESVAVTFDTWTLAFLVDIKMIEVIQDQMADIWVTRYRESALGRLFADRIVKHLVLDLENAKFLLDYSSLNGIWDYGVLPAVNRLETVVYHTVEYLKRLAHHGHHAIYSVPLVEDNINPFGVTSVDFQVVSHTPRDLSNYHRVRTAPVILVTGMVGNRAMVRRSLTWHDAWVARGAFGTLAMSHETFLDGRLLPIFAKINEKTTVLPRFPNPDEDEYSVYLSTLENHPYRRRKRIDWKLVQNSRKGFREYEYNHRDEWSYEHSGSTTEVGSYAVLCHTYNKLAIPTTYSPGLLEVALSGESVLTIRGTNEHKDWSQTSRATWSTVIRVYSEWNGLRIDIGSTASPVYDETKIEGTWSLNAHELLSTHLPNIIDVKGAISELKHALEGSWDYAFPGLLSYNFSNPVFTVDGDLIVQLRVHDPYYKPSLQPVAATKPYRGGLLTPSTPVRARTPSLTPSPTNRKRNPFGQSPGGANGNGYGNGNHIAPNAIGIDGLSVPKSPASQGYYENNLSPVALDVSQY